MFYKWRNDPRVVAEVPDHLVPDHTGGLPGMVIANPHMGPEHLPYASTLIAAEWDPNAFATPEYVHREGFLVIPSEGHPDGFSTEGYRFVLDEKDAKRLVQTPDYVGYTAFQVPPSLVS